MRAVWYIWQDSAKSEYLKPAPYTAYKNRVWGFSEKLELFMQGAVSIYKELDTFLSQLKNSTRSAVEYVTKYVDQNFSPSRNVISNSNGEGRDE